MSGRLVILGRRSILLYTLPASHDPASMELTDVISNLGCSARDSFLVLKAPATSAGRAALDRLTLAQVRASFA